MTDIALWAVSFLFLFRLHSLMLSIFYEYHTTGKKILYGSVEGIGWVLGGLFCGTSPPTALFLFPFSWTSLARWLGEKGYGGQKMTDFYSRVREHV